MYYAININYLEKYTYLLYNNILYNKCPYNKLLLRANKKVKSQII